MASQAENMLTSSLPAPEAKPASKQEHHYKFRWQRRGFAIPAILVVIVIFYAPFLYTFFISFTLYDGVKAPAWVGLQNYDDLFTDETFYVSAFNTLLWVVGTLVIPVAVGLIVAVMTYDSPLGKWLRLPFLIPYAVSGVAVGILWSFVFQPDGALTEMLALFHVPFANSEWLASGPLNTIMMILASAWQGVGVNALLFVVGLQSIPKDPMDAARLDGATGLRLFRWMTWPMLRPITTVVIGLSIVGSLKTFDIVWTMTKGGPGVSSQTLAVEMYSDTFISAEYGKGSAVAVILTIITLVVSLLYIRKQLQPKYDF